MKQLLMVCALVAINNAVTAEDWINHFGKETAQPVFSSSTSNDELALTTLFPECGQFSQSDQDLDWLSREARWTPLAGKVVRGQDSGGGAGGGGAAGASAATDPSATLTQLQIQNIFAPESYGASGYANTAIVQPVLPFPVAMPGLKEFFPAHIVRPTLPFPAPTADPDGPAGAQSGMGDLTLLDAYVHPMEGFGTMLLGYNAIIPTSTHRQLGLGEWQIGPAAALLYKQIPKVLIGGLVTTQFSTQSEAQQINVSPILVKHLEDDWYIRWGDIFWTFNTDTGDYNIPLEVAVGKVVKMGDQPINIFVEPFYTPADCTRDLVATFGV